MADNIEIPEGWMETTLGEVIEIQSGKSRPKETGIFPVYGGNGILDYANNFNIEKPSIIVGRVGAYCGCVYFERSKFWLSDNALGIHNNKKSEIKFLYYFLINQNLNKKAIGGAQPLITQGILNGVKITIPLVPEQQAIARMLSSFDDKIELLREQNETLEKTAQTIFQEWFGKYGVDDELPEGWRVGKLGEISTLKSGFPFAGEDFTECSETCVLKIKDLKGNGMIDLSDISFVNDEVKSQERVMIFKLNTGDIVLAMSGNTTGKIGVVPENKGNIYLNQRVGKFFLKNEKYKSFLYFFLMSGNYEEKILNMGYGSAQPNINPSQIENIDILFPNEDKFNDYISISDGMFDKILTNLLQIQSLSKARDELLPKLMSGDVRV